MRPEGRWGRYADPWWRRAARDGGDPVALDQELQPLVAELEAAGARARSRHAAAGTDEVDAAFAAALRQRLLDRFAADGAALSPAGSDAAAGPAPGLASRAPGLPGRPIDGSAGDPAGYRRPAAVSSVEAAPVRIALRRTEVGGRVARRQWAVLAAAAAVIVAVAGLELGATFPTRPTARTADAIGTVLIRAGAERPLRAGAALEAGDLVRVGPGGQALVDVAGGQARLAEGAELRLDRLEARQVELAQLAGRVYHRVSLQPGGAYRVETASLRWTAVGTAFDLDVRTSAAASTVRELSIEHAVRVEGPGLTATVPEGQAAMIQLADGSANLATVPLSAADLGDPWLLANARRDLESGYGLGVLTGLALLPTASPAPPIPSTAPAQPTAGAGPVAPGGTASPTPKATAKATIKATPKPSPTPTAAPTLGAMSLSLTPCDGSFVLASWSKWLGEGFHHYQGLRSGSSSIPTSWPPPGDIAAPESLHSTVATANSGVDGGLTPGSTPWYRVVAYDAANNARAATSVVSTTVKPVKALGTLSVGTAGPNSTSFSWTPYGGGSACFGYYKLVYSDTDPTPSYLEGAPHLWASGTKSDASVTIDDIAPGTWCFRLQVLRDTPGGTQLVAETEVTTFVVP
jgi:ferric-dicitrate binding protein FerR (iron transport regulator)